jgi:hypothetical protein
MSSQRRRAFRFRSAFEDVLVLRRGDVTAEDGGRALGRLFARTALAELLCDPAQRQTVLDLYAETFGAALHRPSREHDELVASRLHAALDQGELVALAVPVVIGPGANRPGKAPVQKEPERPREEPKVVCELVHADVHCAHDDKPRRPSKDGLLEVVPAETGDTITLEGKWNGGCDHHPEWEVRGFFAKTEKKPKTTFKAMPWFVGSPTGTLLLRWLSGVAPKTYEVSAHGCSGQGASYVVKSYPSDRLTVSFKDEEWKSLRERIDFFVKNVLGNVLDVPEGLEFLKGSASLAAGWSEWARDHRAYYKWEASIGFNPLIGGKVKATLGPTAAVPQVIKKLLQSNVGFFVELSGGISVNAKWARVTPEKAKAFGEATGAIQGRAGVELKFASKKLLSVEVAGKTGISLKAAPDYADEKPTLLLELKWDGIKGTVTAAAAWGWVEIESEYTIVDERLIWDKRPFSMLEEHAPG